MLGDTVIKRTDDGFSRLLVGEVDATGQHQPGIVPEAHSPVAFDTVSFIPFYLSVLLGQSGTCNPVDTVRTSA